MIKRLLFTLLCFCSVTLFAQQAPPIGVIPTYYNSGFAGEAGAPRISSFSFLTAYRGNSRALQYGNYLSYDNFFKKIRSGVSLTAGQLSHNSETSYQFSSRFMNAAISPKFSFGGKYTLAPFLRFNLVGGRSESTVLSNSPATYESRSLSGSVSSGVLFNSSNWYVGFTVGSREFQHTFYTESNVPPSNSGSTASYWTPSLNWSFQAGYTFQSKPDSKFSFTPQIAFSPFRYRQWFSYTIGNQTTERTFSDHGVRIDDMNLMFRYKKIIAGANVQGVKIDKYFFQAWKDPDISIGYQTKKFRILLNQNYTKGVYEGKVGLRYLFPKSADNGPVSIQ